MIKYATRLPPGKPVELLSDRVVRKIVKYAEKEDRDFIEALVTHFINKPNKNVVPVYNFLYLPEIDGKRKTKYGYSYDMMRCGLLSHRDREIVDYIGDMELFDSSREESLACLADDVICRGIAKENPALYKFLLNITLEKRYWDLHSGNVMMNEDEDYCVVDLEGFVHFSPDQEEFNWIRE